MRATGTLKLTTPVGLMAYRRLYPLPRWLNLVEIIEQTIRHRYAGACFISNFTGIIMLAMPSNTIGDIIGTRR